MFLGPPEPVTLVTLAPITTIALLLRTYPEAARGIGGIVAHLGIPLTLYGLDVFCDPTVTLKQARTLAAADGPATRLAGLRTSAADVPAPRPARARDVAASTDLRIAHGYPASKR